jgi:arylsulfatase A-like enzyme
LLAACPRPALPAPKPRGVLLISIDSLRADHLSCYGYQSTTAPDVATSPHIDALAAQGIAFDQAVSTTSWTLPAHMALLTGLPNELHGVRHASQQLHPDRRLLAEVLAAAGWRTAGFFSGPNVHPHFGFGRGFERYVDCSTKKVDDPSVFSVDQGSADVRELKELQRLSHQGVTSPRLVAAFDEWFAGVGAKERFLAFVHMWDVHYDYAAPQEYVELFDPDYAGWVDGANFWDLVEKKPGEKPRDERDVAHLRALYDAEIRYTDEHVGMLLEGLRAAGRLDDTLVVLVSDHGEEFFEHDDFGHNRTLFEEVLRVPVVMRYPPRFPAGKRVPDLVSLLDVVPTVLELCDVAPPPETWGRSLLPVLTGGPLAPRAVPLELTYQRLENVLAGYRGAACKVTRYSKSREPVLYDLARDPAEQRELKVGEGPDALSPKDPRLDSARRLWADLARIAARLERLDGNDLPADLLEDLRRNGYLGGREEEQPVER